MPDVVIENPVLNSPYLEPTRHFKFSDEGITDVILNQRRSSAYFIPIAKPKKKGKQLAFDTEWTQEVTRKDNTIPHALLLHKRAHDGADRIYRAIVQSTQANKALKPILRPYGTVSSTVYMDFDTVRPGAGAGAG